eukprot:6210076-Pleurochrysis_carterae.AAC.2
MLLLQHRAKLERDRLVSSSALPSRLACRPIIALLRWLDCPGQSFCSLFHLETALTCLCLCYFCCNCCTSGQVSTSGLALERKDSLLLRRAANSNVSGLRTAVRSLSTCPAC